MPALLFMLPNLQSNFRPDSEMRESIYAHPVIRNDVQITSDSIFTALRTEVTVHHAD